MIAIAVAALVATSGAMVPVTAATAAPSVDRISGPDRYTTAVEISKSAYPGTAPVAYIATGLVFSDALSAAPAAAKEGGPLLLTRGDSLPVEVRDELRRLKPAKVVVVGGPGSVSAAVFGQIKALTKNTVRIGGVDRYEASRNLIAYAFPSATTAYVATGRDFPDALSASSAAGAVGAPMILVDGLSRSVDAPTNVLLKKLGVKKALIAGGPASVSPGIQESLRSFGVKRFSGADRYEVSRAVNSEVSRTAKHSYLATGAVFSDALAGAAVAGADSVPLYIVRQNCVPSAIKSDLSGKSVTLLGGTGSLGAEVAKLTSCSPSTPTPTPTPTPDGSTNFVSNGTFNSGLSGWEAGKNTSLSLGSGRSGTKGVKVSNNSSQVATSTLNDSPNSVALAKIGHTYQLTAWIRAETPGQKVTIKILEEDSKFNVIGSQQAQAQLSDTAWKSLTVRYTVDRDDSSLDVNIYGSGIGVGKSIIVDDVALVDTTSGLTTPPKPGDSENSGAWNLAWSDEFNGDTVNRNFWNVDDLSTYGDGNKELACLMDRPENVKVANGILTIAALKEKTPIQCGNSDGRFPGGRSYTSGMLTTKNKVSFEHGRFEIRAKVPTVQGKSKGIWPAFWMRPVEGGIGELDILEIIGTGKNDPFSANHVSQTIHYDYSGTWPKQGTGYDLPSGDFSDGFHTYAVEWETGSIKWFVDGILTYERTDRTTPWLDEAFVDDFYLRLNMAVGGSWPGAPDADTVFPSKYEIDYVRVYQR